MLLRRSVKALWRITAKNILVWASLDEDIKMYPEFFKTELKDPTDTVKLFTTDKR